MQTTRGRKAASHERIVARAAHALRRDGFERVGVSEVMRGAGLTHGGFYAHFDSRDAMLAEALERAGADSASRLGLAIERLRGQGADALGALIDAYLSDEHLAAREEGCPLAALASDLPRQAEPIRLASQRRIDGLLRLAAEALAPEAGPGDALGLAGALVGALQLARAAGSAAQGRRMLAEARASLRRRFGPENH